MVDVVSKTFKIFIIKKQTDKTFNEWKSKGVIWGLGSFQAFNDKVLKIKEVE